MRGLRCCLVGGGAADGAVLARWLRSRQGAPERSGERGVDDYYINLYDYRSMKSVDAFYIPWMAISFYGIRNNKLGKKIYKGQVLYHWATA